MKTDIGNLVIGDPDYIIVDLAYDRKLVLPFQKGMEFIKIWSSALELVGYHDDLKLEQCGKEFQIKFITEQDLEEIKVRQLIDPEEN